MADSIYSGLSGIPIDLLVASPLISSATANLALANVLQEFVLTVAYENGTDGTLNQVELAIERPYQDPDTGKWATEAQTVTVPMISLVPLPALLIDTVSIKFSTTVSSTQTLTSDTSATLGGSYGFGAFKMTGNVATEVKTDNSSTQSASYSFDIEAKQQPPTQGMVTLDNILASTIQPMPTSQ